MDGPPSSISAPVQFWHGEPPGATGSAHHCRRRDHTAAGHCGSASAAPGARPRGTQPGVDTPRYRMLNVEGEWAFGHTKVSGEWIRDRFALAAGTAIARGWTLQAQHTLAPRVFVHARTTFMSSPDGTDPYRTRCQNLPVARFDPRLPGRPGTDRPPLARGDEELLARGRRQPDRSVRHVDASLVVGGVDGRAASACSNDDRSAGVSSVEKCRTRSTMARVSK